MRFALIPPLQFLEQTWKTQYQLMLPHMLKNAKYTDTYKALCDSSNQYVILDNGAAESVDQYDARALIIIAEHFGADEIVATDVLGNATLTFETTRRFVDVARVMGFKGRIGMVAQGRDIYEAFDLANILIDECPEIGTVFIPRLLVTEAIPSGRLILAKKIHNAMPALDIHLLGASRFWASEVFSAASDIPWIRGMDTSMPYVYAQHDYNVADQEAMPPHRESGDYFHGEWTSFQRELVNSNVKRMLKWSVGVA